MTGTPTMRVRQVYTPEDADLSVFVVTDTEDATLDVEVVTDLSQADASVRTVLDRAEADLTVRVVEGALFPPSGPSHLLLDGSPGTYASTPHRDEFDLVTGMSARAMIALDTWFPVEDQYVLVKWHLGNTGEVYTLLIEATSGALVLGWGLNNERRWGYFPDPPEVPLAADGQPLGIRIDLTPNVADEDHVRFFIRPGETLTALAALESAIGWTELGTEQIITPSVPMVTSPDSLVTGSEVSTNEVVGKEYAIVLKDINGATVASPDFTIQPPGTTSFTDAQGNTWTVSGNAQIV